MLRGAVPRHLTAPSGRRQAAVLRGAVPRRLTAPCGRRQGWGARAQGSDREVYIPMKEFALLSDRSLRPQVRGAPAQGSDWEGSAPQPDALPVSAAGKGQYYEAQCTDIDPVNKLLKCRYPQPFRRAPQRGGEGL